MAVTVNFYTFNKKQNSTKQPTGTGTSYQCLLREPCDVLSPTIALDYGTASNPSALNYCYIADFNRYYYVNDWTYDTGLWYASCSVDALASWKTNIGNSEQYITRSTYLANGSTKVYNTYISDDLYPTLTDVVKDTVSYSTNENFTPWDYSFRGNNCCYVIGILNNDSGNGSAGAVSYYVFTPAQFDSFKQNLLNAAWWDNPDANGSQIIYDEDGQTVLQRVAITLGKAQIDPFKYIVTCVYFPFTIPHADTALSQVRVGWFNVPCSCYKPLTNYITTFDFELPSHPQVSRGAYLNGAPYTRYTLNCYSWGSIPLDATLYVGEDTLHCAIVTDYVSGEAQLTIYGSHSPYEPVYKATATVGVPVQLAQITSNILGATTGVISGAAQIGAGIAASTVTAGAGIGGIFGGITKIGSSLGAALPQVQTSGANGSIVAFYDSPKLMVTFYQLAEEHFDHLGRPYCHSRDVNELSGYMMIGDADVDFACYPSEKETIISNMEGGFFYE